MKALRVVLVSVALLVTWLAGTVPARAAIAGFHAAYFSESGFLSLATGETGQFSVGFTNTGTEAWAKGIPGREASLHTAAPLDNPLDFVNGWASGWKSQNIYAVQSNDLVAPGQVGFFVFNVRVPSGAPLAPHTFYGRPSIDGVGYLEDYGYYQVVSVRSALAITSATPPSPSTNRRPTIAGNGAAALETVTIQDGANGPSVGAGSADASGAFSIPLTTSLSNGTHTLFATTATKGASAGFPYTISITGPQITRVKMVTQTQLVVTFSTAMKCATSPGRNDITNPNNYFTNVTSTGALGPSTVTALASTDCTQATLNLSTSLTTDTNYTLIVAFVQDSAGNNISSDGNSAPFDTFRPTLLAWQAKQEGTLTLTFSKGMSTLGGSSGSSSVINPGNYIVDNITVASNTIISCQSVDCSLVRIQFNGGSSGPVGLAGTVHTFSISNVADESSTLVINPNPTARQVTTQA